MDCNEPTQQVLNFHSVENNENPLFIEMAESYIKLKQIDLENAEKWKENSQIMAKLLCDTEIQANEENFNINKEKLDLRAKMLIKYKFNAKGYLCNLFSNCILKNKNAYKFINN